MTDAGLNVLGLMSGTSVDALDAAVVHIREGDEADALEIEALAYRETPFDEALRARVQALFDPEKGRTADVCEVNALLGEAFADAGQRAMADAGVAIDLVASHGQTVWHEVRAGHPRSTLQLGEPSAIAERLDTTVVADFRPRDIAAGGQGAPLSSWADALLFGAADRGRAVQNIGGMSNVTWLPADGDAQQVLAFDTGPGNALMDHAVARLTDGAQHFDRDGALAGAGQADEVLLRELLAHPYFALPPPKSTGRELFGAAQADLFLARAQARGLKEADVLATLGAFTARAIADQYRRFLPAWPDEVIVGGGGAHNPTLMSLLAEAVAPATVLSHEAFGLSSSGREAVYFALMGYEALHGRPNTLPACTGAAHPVVMGKIVPGPNYRALLARVAGLPERHIRRLILRSSGTPGQVGPSEQG